MYYALVLKIKNLLLYLIQFDKSEYEKKRLNNDLEFKF